MVMRSTNSYPSHSSVPLTMPSPHTGARVQALKSRVQASVHFMLPEAYLLSHWAQSDFPSMNRFWSQTSELLTIPSPQNAGSEHPVVMMFLQSSAQMSVPVDPFPTTFSHVFALVGNLSTDSPWSQRSPAVVALMAPLPHQGTHPEVSYVQVAEHLTEPAE